MFIDQLDSRKEHYRRDPISWRRIDHTPLQPYRKKSLGWLDEIRVVGLDGGNS